MARTRPHRSARLGQMLKDLRMKTGLTLVQVEELTGLSDSALSRLESGAGRRIAPANVEKLLDVYKPSDEVRAAVAELVEGLAKPSRLATRIPGVPATVYELDEIEADAAQWTDWSPLIVPGLLQTREYGQAFLANSDLPRETVGRILTAREERQSNVLPKGQYVAYVDELVLSRPIGGPACFRRQLQHLLDVQDKHAAVIRITPVTTDGHPGLAGPFLLLEYRLGDVVVHIEGLHIVTYLEGDDVAPYRTARDLLDSVSLDAEESTGLIAEAIRKLQVWS